VVIPVHNIQKTKQCLKALALQTYQAMEIIQVRQRGFPAEKRNYGFKNSHGTFILFLDEDEYLSPTAIEECVHKAKEGYDIVSIPVRKKLGGSYLQQCLSLIRENTVKSLFMRRDVLLDIGLFDPGFVLSDDLDLLGRATRENYSIGTISAGYMFHDEDVTVRSIIQKTILTRKPFRKLKIKYGDQAFQNMVRASHHRRRIISGLLSTPKYFFGVSIIMLIRSFIRRIP
jgi:glycosyltransferase involved in cell wall biosynthesis